MSVFDVITSLHQGDTSVVTFHAKIPGFADLGGIPLRDLSAKWPKLSNYLHVDSYFSINSAYERPDLKKTSNLTGLTIYSRRGDHLRWLNAAYVEIDNHENANFSFEFTSTRLLQEISVRRLPEPGLIVSSGRGVWLMWPLRDHRDCQRPVQAFPEKRERYQNINRTLCEIFSQHGADRSSTDPARVMRVPGSVNSSASEALSVVRFFQYSTSRYSLSELEAAFGIGRKAVNRQESHRPKDSRKVSAGRRRWQKPLAGFRRLARLRGHFSEGTRHSALWVLAVLLFRNGVPKPSVIEECRKLAGRCTPNLLQKDIDRCVSGAQAAVRRHFKRSMSNATIARMLKITEAETRQLTEWLGPKRVSCPPKLAERRRHAIVEELQRRSLWASPNLWTSTREMARTMASEFQIHASHTSVGKDYKAIRALWRADLSESTTAVSSSQDVGVPLPPLSLYQHTRVSSLKNASFDTTKSTMEDELNKPTVENNIQETDAAKVSASSEEKPIQSGTDDDPIMTPKEAAKYFRISVATLLRKSRESTIPGFRVGEAWRYRKSELDERLRSNVSFFRHPCRK